MSLPNITATGRLGADVELTFTPAGKALAKFRIACGERIKDQSGEWKDGDTTWLNIALWEKDAEAAAEHLKKGDEVNVTGLLLVREYEAKDGTRGKSVEVKWAKVYKARLDQGNRQSQPAPPTSNGWGQQSQPQQAPANDPWSTPPADQSAPF